MTHYFAHDANFNHTTVFDTNKNVIERYWYYSAYGDPAVYDSNFAHDGDGVSDIANSTTFTGRSLDTETGLYYYRNRYYHSQLGRSVGRDPIGYVRSYLNLHEYCGGQSVNFTYPFGEKTSDDAIDRCEVRNPTFLGAALTCTAPCSFADGFYWQWGADYNECMDARIRGQLVCVPTFGQAYWACLLTARLAP